MTIKPKEQFVTGTRELISLLQEPQDIVVAGLRIKTDPAVFNPGVFFSSTWFAGKVAALVKGESVFVEVGCGTGVISIKVALTNPNIRVHSTDVNFTAAKLTRANARENGAMKLDVHCGDVLDSVPESIKADSIFWAMPFGYLDPGDVMTGRDEQVFDPGYRAIRKFFSYAGKNLTDTGRLLIGFSNDIGHYELLEEIATENGFALKLLDKTKGFEKDAVSMEIYEARK